MNNETRSLLGIPLRDTVRTAAVKPTQRPDLFVQDIDKLSHILKIDNNKFDGVIGVQIFQKIGGATPPMSTSEMQVVAIATRSRIEIQLDEADAGQKAWYRARLMNRRGEFGPDSEAVAATIAA